MRLNYNGICVDVYFHYEPKQYGDLETEELEEVYEIISVYLKDSEIDISDLLSEETKNGLINKLKDLNRRSFI